MKSTIGIPSPCAEDWSKMTPTQKGAYCGKCQFDVTDFTKMSPEEIRDTLKMNAGKKTCGHISKTQIDLVNTNYHVWENQPPSVFRSKFLYACLMVFGMSLFTGCQSNADDLTVGELEQEVGMLEEDTTTSCDGTYVCEDGDLIDGMMVEDLGEIEMFEEDSSSN